MSTYIEELDNLKLYKRRFFLPISRNDKFRGSAIMLMTPDFATSKKMIVNKFIFENNFFKSYYLENSASFIINNGILNERAELIEEATSNKKLLIPIRGLNTKEAELLAVNTHPFNIKTDAITLSLVTAFVGILSSSLAILPASLAMLELPVLINQLHAIDFIGLGKNNDTGKQTDHGFKYYIYDTDVVACANGKVVDCASNYNDDVDTNRSSHILGNYVIIQHDNGVFSLYAHLQKRSLQVKKGDIIKAGKVIGKVGNSGNSSEPHLHFQLCKFNPKYMSNTGGIAPTLSLPLDNFEDHMIIPLSKDSFLDIIDSKVINNIKYPKTLNYKNNTSGKIHPCCLIRTNKSIKEECIVIESNNYEDALEVFESLTDEEKNFVSHRGIFVDSDRIIFRHIEYDKKKPIAFIDLYKDTENNDGIIVYAIKKEYRNKGLAKKLLDIAIDYAKNDGNITNLVYKVTKGNNRSLKIAKNLKDFKLKSNNEFIMSIKESINAPFMPFDKEYIVSEDMIRTPDIISYITEAEAKYNPLLKKALFKERLRTNKDVFSKYNDLKQYCTNINKTFMDIKRYRGLNLFVDWSYYTELFFKNLKLTKLKALDFYYDFIDRFLFDARLNDSGYHKKTVFVPLTGWDIKKDSSIYDWNDNINPFSMIHRYIRSNPEKLKKWGLIDFVFIHPSNGYFKVDFDKFEFKDLHRFTSCINKLMANESFEDSNIYKISPKAITTIIVDKLEKSSNIKINNLTGEDKKISKEELDDKINSALLSSDIEEKKKVLVTAIKHNAENNNTAEETLQDMNDENIKRLIIDITQNDSNNIKVSAARVARFNQVKDSFLNKKIKNSTVKELIEMGEKPTPIEKMSIDIESIDDEWENLTHPNFENSYHLDSDIINIMNSLSEKSNPVTVLNVDIEDISTSEDSVYLYTFFMEDYSGKRFTLAFEVPKFKNNRFMKLRGNDKTINGQLMNLPIIKTDEDTAQIVSNYNKIFIRRYNTSIGKSYHRVNRIIKTLEKLKDNKKTKVKVQYNDNSFICKKYELPIDYIDLASVINKIECNNIVFYFNPEELRTKYSKEIKDSSDIPIGYNHSTKSVIYAYNGEVVSNVVDDILEQNDEEYAKVADTILNAKRYTYSKASILNTEIPVIVIMGYSEGLQTSLKKANIEYEITDKREKYDKRNYDTIKFKDGYIKYKVTPESSMLLNGLKECNTEDYSIKNMNERSMWIDFLDMYGGRIKADGLDNFYDLMMDPITVNVCKSYNLPHDYCEALAYASFLLIDNKYNRHVDITGNRFRTNEIIAGYVYKAIATSYAEYNSQLKRNKKEATMTIKRSAVIDSVMLDPTFSDLSILTPVLELESANSVSFKGLSGMNSDRSYGLDKRIYDKSMLNKLAMSTGFSGNVGITRQATIDMAIETGRGMIKESDISEMSDSKTLCITEALTPFGTTHDDPMRIAMNFIQTAKHGMRTKHSDPLLVSNGADMALPYLTSDEFSYKAKANGVVKEVTKDYMIIQYDAPKGLESNKNAASTAIVDLRENVKKNSDGGFYLTTKLDTNLKKGSRFKKGDIIAYDNLSYSDAIGDGSQIAYRVGNLAKVAIMNTDEGFEDSAIISSKLSEDMSSKIIIKKDGIILPKNANVYNIVKKGQPIQEGEPLMVFQNAFDDETANSLLKTLSIDDEVTELGHIPIKSKITGIVKDIKVYRTVEKSELSSSLKKLVDMYESEYDHIRSAMKKNKIDDKEFDAPNYKLQATGKLKNAQDSVMIEFYLEFDDKLSVGDKIVYYSAVKGVVKDIFPKDKEPYTDFRPNEKIHSLVPVQGTDNRMVTSILIVGSVNKILIELDRKVKEIMGVPWTDLDDNKP